MRLIFSCFILLLFACNQTGISDKELFDVPAFFSLEISQVKQNFKKLHKTFVYDNKSDSLDLKNFDPEKELVEFLEIDLNKAAYVGAFKKSEIKLDSASFLLIYESTQKGMDLNKVEIVFRKKIPQTLKFYFAESNNLYESGKELFYEVNKGFVKSGFQRTKFKDPVKYRIEGNFIN